jgi:hypothetical protein
VQPSTGEPIDALIDALTANNRAVEIGKRLGAGTDYARPLGGMASE